MGMPTLTASNWPRRKSLTKPGLNISQCQFRASLVEQGKRLALEQWLAASDQSHYRALTDEETKQACQRDRLATADLRLSAQPTPPPHLVVTECQPPPAPAAWFMTPLEPDLTQRMLNELSESPATAIKD